jgi:branched-chain amino acid transport system permease protein
MAAMAIGSVWVARTIEKGKLGRGLNSIKDNEEAAECMGVPTLRLKLIATTISGSLMGMAGAVFPSYLTFVDPPTAFNLEFAINSLAMPMIGGTFTWIGPVVGALLLGTVQQVAIVTISSELNLLIIGVLLVVFVTIAPHGIVGWFMKKNK